MSRGGFANWVLSASLLMAPMITGAPGHAGAESKGAGPIVTLQRAHELAIENNPDLKAVGERVRQAELMRWRAWAIVLPTIFVDGAVTRNDQEIPFEIPNFEDPNAPPEKMVIQELWGKRWGVTTNMTLFNAQSIPLIQNAYDHIDAARLEAQFQRNELLFGVTGAYYGASSAGEAVDIALADVKTAEEFLRLAKAKQAVGVGGKIEVLQAELSVNEARTALDDAHDAVRLGRTSLGYIVGLEGSYQLERPTDPEAIGGDLSALKVRAHENRLDLQALRIQRTMADRERDRTYSRWVPVFDVTHNYAWDSAGGFAGDSDSWRLIFGARWNLFEGGEKITQLKEDESKIRQAGHLYEAQRRRVDEQVERAFVQLEQARRNVLLAEQRVHLAQEGQHLVTRQYEGGLTTGLHVLDATTSLRRARQGLVLKVLCRDLALLSLARAVGVNHHEGS